MIHNVVFDIGWVLVHLNPRPILDMLAAHQVPCSDLETLVARIGLDDHECGRLHGFGLLERIQELTRRAATPDHCHAKWLDMFELQPDMVRLAHRLSDSYRVFLLSNIGDLHWSHMCREYGLHRIGHGVLLSYLAGAMKPHEAIYAQAERRFGLEPVRTVFIDDRAENIAAARARGWKGIVHAGHASTVAELRALGVSI